MIFGRNIQKTVEYSFHVTVFVYMFACYDVIASQTAY